MDRAVYLPFYCSLDVMDANTFFGNKTSDESKVGDGGSQDDRTNLQAQSFGSSNSAINTDGLVAPGLPGFNLNGNAFISPHEHALRLAGMHTNGIGLAIPRGSVNRLVPNNMGLINPGFAQHAGIPLPISNTNINTGSFNAVGMGLMNFNNLGLIAVPTVTQPVMVATAPLLATANSGLSPEMHQQLSMTAGLGVPMTGMPREVTCQYPREVRIPRSTTQIENSIRPYRDYSRVPEDVLTGESTESDEKKSAGGGNFPSKLHDILSREEFFDIISWMPHGRSWKVHKPKELEEKIIPQFFRHSKYNSFTRQVNGWGFHRITQGADHNTYYHELFLRGLPHLCKHMRRLSAAVYGKNDMRCREEPDFYQISEITPLPEVNGEKASQESTSTTLEGSKTIGSPKKDEENNIQPSSVPNNATAVPSSVLHDNNIALFEQNILNQSMASIGPNYQHLNQTMASIGPNYQHLNQAMASVGPNYQHLNQAIASIGTNYQHLNQAIASIGPNYQHLNQAMASIGPNYQHLQSQLLPQIAMRPFFAIDSNNIEHNLLIQQTMFESLPSPHIGGSIGNVGARNMNPSSIQVIEPQVAAQQAASRQGSNVNDPNANLLDSYFD